MKSNKALYRVQIPKLLVNNEKEEIELDWICSTFSQPPTNCTMLHLNIEIFLIEICMLFGALSLWKVR